MLLLRKRKQRRKYCVGVLYRIKQMNVLIYTITFLITINIPDRKQLCAFTNYKMRILPENCRLYSTDTSSGRNVSHLPLLHDCPTRKLLLFLTELNHIIGFCGKKSAKNTVIKLSVLNCIAEPNVMLCRICGAKRKVRDDVMRRSSVGSFVSGLTRYYYYKRFTKP